MILSLEKFKEKLNTKYFFHFHTNYTDGKSNLEEYFKLFHENNYKTIIFCEHVRKNLTFNFDDFIKEVNNVNRRYNFDIIIGVESKLKTDGELDIDLEILKNVSLIGIACHNFPESLDLFFESFKKVIKNPLYKDYIKVLVHPGRFLKIKNKLNDNINKYLELLRYSIKKNIFIEINLVNELPPKDILKNFFNKENLNNFILGYDIHSIDEFYNYNKKI